MQLPQGKAAQPPAALQRQELLGAPRRSRHLLLYFLALFPLPSENVNNKLRNMLNITYIKEKKKSVFLAVHEKAYSKPRAKVKINQLRCY